MIGAGLFCLFIFLSGFVLSRSGKPYNGLIFNIHKLIALAAVILLVRTLYRENQTSPLDTMLWIATLATGLCVLGLFVTGGLLSVDKPMPDMVLRLHHLAPYLAVLATATTLFLLSSPSS